MVLDSARLCRCSKGNWRRDRVVARRDASWRRRRRLSSRAVGAVLPATVPRGAARRVPVQSELDEVAIEKIGRMKRGAPRPARQDCTAGRARTAGRDALVVVRLPGREPILQGHVDGLEVDVPRHRAHEQGRMPPVRDLQPRVGRGESDSGRGIAMSPTGSDLCMAVPNPVRLDSTVRSPHAHHHQLPT